MTGDLITKEMEKDRVLNAFFSSVFISKTSLQAPEIRHKVCSKEDLPSVEEFADDTNWEMLLTYQMVAQRGCVVSVLGDIQKPSGHSSGQPAVNDPA